MCVEIMQIGEGSGGGGWLEAILVEGGWMDSKERG